MREEPKDVRHQGLHELPRGLGQRCALRVCLEAEIEICLKSHLPHSVEEPGLLLQQLQVRRVPVVALVQPPQDLQLLEHLDLLAGGHLLGEHRGQAVARLGGRGPGFGDEPADRTQELGVGDREDLHPDDVDAHGLQAVDHELRGGLPIRTKDHVPGLSQLHDVVLPHGVLDHLAALSVLGTAGDLVVHNLLVEDRQDAKKHVHQDGALVQEAQEVLPPGRPGSRVVQLQQDHVHQRNLVPNGHLLLLLRGNVPQPAQHLGAQLHASLDGQTRGHLRDHLEAPELYLQAVPLQELLPAEPPAVRLALDRVAVGIGLLPDARLDGWALRENNSDGLLKIIHCASQWPWPAAYEP
mmetsp:Transcript_61366/g.179997  ORF Transcript_61366/g.179997 Transcript_61366/m.179997 type:complete len:353 (+) Transcript_61366:784-1842(+)